MKPNPIRSLLILLAVFLSTCQPVDDYPEQAPLLTVDQARQFYEYF
ncbi:MAG: hypothetical protein AB2L24_07870 [Mangrovibacterium sp.]